MKITIVGTGYVGLVSATCFAEMGHVVTCLDVDERKICMLNDGIVPIYEPGLEELVKRTSKAKRLKFTLDPALAYDCPEICFIAVPTQSASTGEADLRHVFAATDTLVKHLKQETLIVIKSTVPVGTTEKVKAYLNQSLKEKTSPFLCDVAFNPEFLKEGAAVADFMKPDRIILGTETFRSLELLKQAYSPFAVNHSKTIHMSPNSAEMTKYAANVMLASRISLMNEFANFCEKVGANIHDVRVGIGSDDRIGYQFLYPGLGFGGSCFPKDIRALKAMMCEQNIEPTMIEAIERVNQKQKLLLVDKLLSYFQTLKGKTVALLGLSFKPDTDDIREAPSINIIQELLNHNVKLKLFDPASQDHMKKMFAPSELVIYAEDEYSALEDADALVLVTEWKQFRQIDLEKAKEVMRTKAIFDGRNQYDRKRVEDLGFYYEGIGT